MRRAKLGDVYAIKVPNWYKLCHWAYSIPNKSPWVRVFPSLYDAIPDNIDEIVAGMHTYVISFGISRAYNIGLAEFIANIPVSDEHPFPKYAFSASIDEFGKLFHIKVVEDFDVNNSKSFYVNSLEEMPDEYQHMKRIIFYPSLDWMLYLFDSGFTPDAPEKFYPGCIREPGLGEKILKPYQDIVDEYVNRYNERRKVSKGS